MAHLHPSHLYAIRYYNISSTKDSRKIPSSYNVSSSSKQTTTRLKKSRGLVHCCSSTSSTDQQVSLDSGGFNSYEAYKDNKLRLNYLASDDEKWDVRRIAKTEDEMREVAYIQAEAFHEPVFLFDGMFFEFFKAEVLSGLLHTLKNSPPDRYACLVAEPKIGPNGLKKELVGVVDVTVSREYSVLRQLPRTREYLYISGIAVLKKYRRQKVATALLKACDVLSAIWGYEYLVLRAYEDDYGARKLYSDAGYRVVSGDPPYITSWIGRRRRIVMVKRSPNLP